MKAFTNANPQDTRQAATLARQAQSEGKRAAFAGGGSDLLGLVKDQVVQPDVIVHLATIKGGDRVESSPAGLTIGGLITLDSLSRHERVRRDYAVLAEAQSVGANAVLNVRFAAPVTAQTSVSYVTSPLTATGGAKATTPNVDYVTKSGTLVFKVGTFAKTVAIALRPDTIPDGTESFRVTLTTSAGVLRGIATVTVIDDD